MKSFCNEKIAKRWTNLQEAFQVSQRAVFLPFIFLCTHKIVGLLFSGCVWKIPVALKTGITSVQGVSHCKTTQDLREHILLCWCFVIGQQTDCLQSGKFGSCLSFYLCGCVWFLSFLVNTYHQMIICQMHTQCALLCCWFATVWVYLFCFRSSRLSTYSDFQIMSPFCLF